MTSVIRSPQIGLPLFCRLEDVALRKAFYRLRRPELLSWVPLIPLQKLPVRFSPKRT
jgi:hypothetical protein